MRAGLDFTGDLRQMTVMKTLPFYVVLGLAFIFAGCASDPRPPQVAVPPQWNNAAEPEEAAAEEIEIPELAEGLRLYHGDEEVTMEALARGQIPEGAVIHVAVQPETLHSVVSETLIQLHSMGYLVGIRAVEGSTP
jgi:hypothetical protein